MAGVGPGRAPAALRQTRGGGHYPRVPAQGVGGRVQFRHATAAEGNTSVRVAARALERFEIGGAVSVPLPAQLLRVGGPVGTRLVYAVAGAGVSGATEPRARDAGLHRQRAGAATGGALAGVVAGAMESPVTRRGDDSVRGGAGHTLAGRPELCLATYWQRRQAILNGWIEE